MNTAFLLLAQYGQPLVPVDKVAVLFGLSTEKFIRKCLAGEIALPIVRMGQTQKAARAVHVSDLAQHIDKAHEAATRERDQLARA